MSRSSASREAPRTLEDVVAWVVSLDPVANAKGALTARIESHGGRVATRLGKEVSHIVWERSRSRRPSDKAADEQQLLELFHKLEKMDYPPVVVSPLWVEESIKAGRRLVERKYLVKKPTESLLGRTPGSAGGAAAAKKRKRPAAAVLPKPAEAYELDEFHFSSTQQMQGGGAAGSSGVGAGGAAKLQRRGGAKPAGRGGKPMPAVAEEEEEEEEGDAEGAAEGQVQPPSGAGADTQAVANILTIDLPEDDDPGPTPGGVVSAAEEQDELDTPLAARWAKSSAERGAAWASGGSGRGSEERRGAGAGGGADKRSRLALASGPREQAEEAGDAGGAAAPADGQEAEAMEVGDGEAAAAQHEAGQQQQASGPHDTGEARQREEEEKRREAELRAKGVAERFSVRQLVRHPERPVVLHKGTPLPGALPPSPGDRPAGDPIPIPVVERVTSPWSLAEQLPTQSQSQPTPAGGGGAMGAGSAGRPSVGQPRLGGRRSLLGVSNMRGPSPAGAGAGATPSTAPRPSTAGEGGGTAERALPTPWSTLRPWDGKTAQQAAAGAAGAAQQAAAADENQAGPPQCQQGAAAPPQPQQQQGARPASDGAAGSGGRRSRQAAAAAAADAAAPAAGAGPTHGCIALTSVDAGVTDLARSAVRRLRGLRLCPEGREDGQVTHLVVGDERRTLKLMLAVANGAWLLSPQWVTASLEAGRWLPESQFPAKVRFKAAAERARAALESPDAAPLLGEHAVYVHLPEKARKLMGANAAALKRVAAVLGAKAAPPKTCTMCVVVGGGARPPQIPAGALCLKEEWLLQAAEHFELPLVEDFVIG